MDTELRVDLHEQMHMIRHHLELDQLAVSFCENVADHFLETVRDCTPQHIATVFCAPDHMVLAREDDVAI
jgi:hypothetical protein